MTAEELLDYTRKHVLRDTSVPPLWSDEVILARLSEALWKVAARTHYFIDDDREVNIEPDEVNYTLDPDIKGVHSIRLDGYIGKLQMSTTGWTPNDGIRTRPARYLLNGKTQTVTFYPIPDDNYVAILTVARLPAKLSLDALTDEVELPEEYQLILADWAAFRCYSDNDSDGFNGATADKAAERYFAGLNEIKRDTYRLRFNNTARVSGRRVK